MMTHYIVTHIKADGNHKTEVLDHEPKLDRLQKMVGGYIELVRCSVGLLYVNEEGRREKLPLNFFASAMHGGQVVGDAVHVLAM